MSIHPNGKTPTDPMRYAQLISLARIREEAQRCNEYRLTEFKAEIVAKAAIRPPLDIELLEGLNPDASKKDAIEYCVRLVLYVWNKESGRGKKKSCDYVFIKAKEGENLFAECRYARTLRQKYGFSVGTITTYAAGRHAMQSGSRHKSKNADMERPETMSQAARKSREAEDAEIAKEQGKPMVKKGRLKSGKKR